MRNRIALVLPVVLAALLTFPGVTPTSAWSAAKGAAKPAAGKGGPRPNIVVVMLDDVAATPAKRLFERLPVIKGIFLDRGQRWTKFDGNDPLCCPGRAGFLTGLYTHHHGVVTNQNGASLFHPEETLATELDDAGYWTMIVGKYLNGTSALEDKTPPGWDRAAISNGGYYDSTMWVQGVEQTHENDYSTDVIAGKAVNWLRHMPADKPPFFLLLAPKAPHKGEKGLYPTPAARHVGDKRCAGVGRYKSPAYREEDRSDKPAYVQALTMNRLPLNGWPLVKACEALLSVDEMFERVSDEIVAQGRWSNTLFILTADNGMAWGDHGYETKVPPWTTPLPLWLRWSRRLGSTPSTVSVSGQLTDLAPTILDAAGAGQLGPFPTGQSHADGISLLPTILSSGASVPDREYLVEEHREENSLFYVPPWWGVRTTSTSPLGPWTYSEYDNGECEMYDLTNDNWQLQNLCNNPEWALQQAALAAYLVEGKNQ